MTINGLSLHDELLVKARKAMTPADFRYIRTVGVRELRAATSRIALHDDFQVTASMELQTADFRYMMSS